MKLRIVSFKEALCLLKFVRLFVTLLTVTHLQLASHDTKGEKMSNNKSVAVSLIMFAKYEFITVGCD